MSIQQWGAERKAMEQLARLLADVVAGGVDDVPGRLRQLADSWPRGAGTQLAIVGMTPPLVLSAPSPERLRKASTIRRIFEFWQRELDHPDARLTPDRGRKIQARLREGYREEQIMRAIIGCRESPHHQGENDTGTRYDDIELICRNGSKLEAFMERAPDLDFIEANGASMASVPNAELKRLESEADTALADGAIDVYNRLNKKIAAIRAADR